MNSLFLAYPSRPIQLGSTILSAVKDLQRRNAVRQITPWEAMDIPGGFIRDNILHQIVTHEVFMADITKLNFNVTYEIGYAIAKRKRVCITLNLAVDNELEQIRDVGIFDTLGYQPYENSPELAEYLHSLDSSKFLTFSSETLNKQTPLYLVLPRHKTDTELRLQSRVKKARLKFRTYDPEEASRMGAPDAIENVAQSIGVIIPLLSSTRTGSKEHNLRAAFVAGLAHGMEKEVLLLQEGDDPVPLDYRDLVIDLREPWKLTKIIGEFAGNVTAALQLVDSGAKEVPRNFLEKLHLGASSAENEFFELENYYLETDEYRRAQQGEIQVVAGRKGSGKTALFVRLRNQLRGHKQFIVLDLRPEGFQLKELKDQVLERLKAGTKEHTITAFWEYLLLIEICNKVLEKDRQIYLHDHRLTDLYKELKTSYLKDREIAEGDFAERLLMLTRIITSSFSRMNTGEEEGYMTTDQITQLIYRHDVGQLRTSLASYLQFKKELWILFDNIDKGWHHHGISESDLLILRCLLDALLKISRFFQKGGFRCNFVIFLRNDVLELLVDQTSDRGKLSRVAIDWTDAALLRELLRRRFVFASDELSEYQSFENIWQKVAVSHVEGEESSQYIIERTLMRPRGLLDFLQHCRSHAVNLRHSRIEWDDIRQGEQTYSTDLVTNINYEIGDVFPEASDVLYEFIESPVLLSRNELMKTLTNAGLHDDVKREKVLDFLLWYGVLGIVRSIDKIDYIYDARYSMKKIQALLRTKDDNERCYHINPAFWAGLEIKTEHQFDMHG